MMKYKCLILLNDDYVVSEEIACTNARCGAGRMREEELEVALKVVIVGDGGVGKSSMIQRYCRGTFTRDYKKTIGVDFLERQIE